MPRGAVVILEAGQVVLIERNVQGKESYFLFPGGQVEDGEDVESAAMREAYEELGVEVRLGSLVAVVTFSRPTKKDRTQYYYWAEIVSGRFGTGEGAELQSSLESEKGTYQPVWVAVEKLPELDVRPKALAEAICAGHVDPGGEVLKIRE